jgi:TRAP-type C4-dicarboxylate transport system permease small subunit
LSARKDRFWEKGIRPVSNVLRVVGMGMLSVLMFLGAADVIGRYLFNKPILGTLEVSEILLAGIVFFGWAYTLSVEGHVRVDFFYLRFPVRAQRIVGFFTSFFSLVLFSLITWRAAKTAIFYWQGNKLVPILKIPVFPFQLFVSLGALALCLELIIEMSYFLFQARRGS